MLILGRQLILHGAIVTLLKMHTFFYQNLHKTMVLILNDNSEHVARV